MEYAGFDHELFRRCLVLDLCFLLGRQLIQLRHDQSHITGNGKLSNLLFTVQPSEQARFQEQYWRGVIEFSGTVRLFFNSIQSSRMNLNHTPVVTICIFGVPTHCSDRCTDPSERQSDDHDHGMVPQVGDMGVYDHSHHDRRVYDVCRCRLRAV